LTQNEVAGQVSEPQRSIPLGAPEAHERSTHTPRPGVVANSAHVGVGPTDAGHRSPVRHGGPHRQSLVARQMDS